MGRGTSASGGQRRQRGRGNRWPVRWPGTLGPGQIPARIRATTAGRPAAPPGGGPGSLRRHEHQGEIADDGGDEGVTVTGIRGPGAAACLVLLIPRDGRPMPFGKILFSTERTVVFVTWVCSTCGNHFPDPRPGTCAVCADERQWLPPGGQRWTTLAGTAVRDRAAVAARPDASGQPAVGPVRIHRRRSGGGGP
jgi:hypothetical protein